MGFSLDFNSIIPFTEKIPEHLKMLGPLMHPSAAKNKQKRLIRLKSFFNDWSLYESLYWINKKYYPGEHEEKRVG